MKNIEERKFSMYEVTLNLLMATDPAIIDLMPLMANYTSTLEQNIMSISNHGGTQKLNRKGVTDDKGSLRAVLTTIASDVSRKVQGYAVNIQDLVLVTEVKYSTATLDRLADNIVVIVCNIIYDKANAHLPELAPYGITNLVLADLRNAIDSYYASIPKPRTGIVIRRGATLNLKQLFAATDSLLKKQIDILVGIVKEAHPAFYTSYTNSRKIINPASHPLALRCLVVDEMGAPVAGVVALVTENNSSFKTKTKGGFYIKNFPQGSYQFSFSKEGYLSQPLTVSIANGERTDVKVTLSTSAELNKVS